MARVLVVDDEAGYRRHLKPILAANGHVVEAVSNCEQARSQLELAEFDLLITDWMLANSTNGAQLAARVHGEYPALPILLITGFPPESLRSSTPDGVRAVLEKPLGVQELLRAVEACYPPASPPTP